MSDCGWGRERCAKIAAEESWIIWMLEHWTFAFAFGIVFIVVLFRLPAYAWIILAEMYRDSSKTERR